MYLVVMITTKSENTITFKSKKEERVPCNSNPLHEGSHNIHQTMGSFNRTLLKHVTHKLTWCTLQVIHDAYLLGW